MSGIEYYQVAHESFNIQSDNASAEQTLYVPWQDVVEYTYANIGGLVTVFGVAQFLPGARHPYLPIFCNDVRVEPYGDFDPVNDTWLSATVTLRYGPLKFGQNPQHIDITYHMGTEQTPIPASNLVNANNNSPLPSDTKDFPRNTPVGRLTIKYSFFPTLDPSIWASYIAGVNGSPFLGWGPGTVLFVGVDTQRSISASGGGDMFSYEYEFWTREDPSGNAQWNSMLDDTTGDWIPIQFKKKNKNSVNAYVYPVVELNNLLP